MAREIRGPVARDLIALEREPQLLRATLAVDAEREPQVRDLFAREQRCCAFLTFDFERTQAGLVVSINQARPGETRARG